MFDEIPTNDDFYMCPACEGWGEVQVDGVWCTCGVCNGACGLTKDALDAAMPCAHRFHAEDDTDLFCIDCGAKTPRQ
jgi:hypothetical protein